jgi:hypothetical protein
MDRSVGLIESAWPEPGGLVVLCAGQSGGKSLMAWSASRWRDGGLSDAGREVGGAAIGPGRGRWSRSGVVAPEPLVLDFKNRSMAGETDEGGNEDRSGPDGLATEKRGWGAG